MRIRGMRVLTIAVVGLVVGAFMAACGLPGGSVENRERDPGNAAASPSGSPPTAVTSPPATSVASPTAARPAFLSYAFTDVRDGKQFTLSDLPGKQVLVIGMAVW